MFSQLQVRSAYSLLSGPRSIEDLVGRAKELGYEAMGLTDLDNLYGLHRFLEVAEEAGIRPIIGAELRVAGGSVVALVRDREGFGNLCELISAIKAEAPLGRRETTRPELREELETLSRGLVYASYDRVILEDLAGRVESLYAALSPRRLSALACARRLGLPLLALGDAAFIEAADLSVHRLLKAIGENSNLGRLPPPSSESLDASAQLLFGPAEAEALFASYPEALAANEEVARNCSFSKIFRGFDFPSYGEEARGDGDGEAGGKASYRRLRDATFRGAEARYGELCDAIIDRLEYELGIIERKGFVDYFLVVAEIAGFTARTCGRGSGAASAVAYCLGITNVDPIRHHLYFERFLNEARPDPPDIDIDFAWDERDGVIRRAIERFGRDRCARVANHLCFRPRSALRETAKAYGMPEGDIAACERAIHEGGEAAQWAAKPLWGEILALARRIEGLPRGLSVHCGGLVIAPGPIRRSAPLEVSAEGYPLLQWEKEGTEAAGLVKIDLLGNRSLAVIRDAVENLRTEGKSLIASKTDAGDATPLIGPPSGVTSKDAASFDASTFDAAAFDAAAFERAALGDPETVAMLAEGDTMGVFYIESPAMRQLQKKTRRGDYEDIVIHSSIIRPAANKYITEYVERLHGKKWEQLHPRLEGVFAETLGILVYQEDVSKAAIALAGFDECEADALRKILAKKSKAAKLAFYKERFFSGCSSLGVAKEATAEVWEMMESFAGYSFCKPHSASYALVSFQSAYLRRHHPAEFMAAVLSNGGGFYTAGAYMSEARRMGLSISGPDINLSERKFIAKDEGLVIGLMAIGGLSESALGALLEERASRGPFADLGAFAARLCSPRVSAGGKKSKVSRPEGRDLLALVEAGACDSISGGLARAEQARYLLCARGGAGGLSEGLFGEDGGVEAAAPAIGEMTATRSGASREREAEAEYRALGFLRADHPLSLYAAKVARVDRVRIADLRSHFHEFAQLVCIPVTRKEVLTKDGEEMTFVSLEDETGIVEAVLFPEAYERYGRFLFEERPLVVEGRVESDMGAVSFELTRLEFLAPSLRARLSLR